MTTLTTHDCKKFLVKTYQENKNPTNISEWKLKEYQNHLLIKNLLWLLYMKECLILQVINWCVIV